MNLDGFAKSLIPGYAGESRCQKILKNWIPAFAGMTI